MRLFFDSETSKHEIRESLDEIGEKSYERRVVYSEALLRPPTEAASALIELGDWHLLFGKDHEADSAYRRALDTLKRAGMPAEQIDSLFTPSPEPMLVPVFAPRLIGADKAPAYMGYVDVAVDLNAYGRSEDVRVTSQSGPTTKTIVRRLEKYISKNQFRPLFVNGERVDNHDVALRYYFRY